MLRVACVERGMDTSWMHREGWERKGGAGELPSRLAGMRLVRISTWSSRKKVLERGGGRRRALSTEEIDCGARAAAGRERAARRSRR